VPTRELKPKTFASRAQLRAWLEDSFRPRYRRVTSFYVMSAKQEATQQPRLAHLIACSARQQPISPLLNRKMESRKKAA
jgi:hypothetical protein